MFALNSHKFVYSLYSDSFHSLHTSVPLPPFPISFSNALPQNKITKPSSVFPTPICVYAYHILICFRVVLFTPTANVDPLHQMRISLYANQNVNLDFHDCHILYKSHHASIYYVHGHLIHTIRLA